jgi:GMP synthase-like glutamine amidotransferase
VARQVLFIRNDPTCPEALIGDVFAESGFSIDTFDVLPASSDDPVRAVIFPDPRRYDVIVPLGARWAAYDDTLPWIAAEMAMLRCALDGGAAVFGVCFGGQLLARALGGTVERSARPEIGWHEVQTDDAGLVPGGPWFQWHFDRFTAPPGARPVARNASATQAFVHGRALGVQFHPEVDEALVEQWIADGAEDMAALGVDAGDLRARTTRVAGDAAARLRQLVRGLLALG